MIVIGKNNSIFDSCLEIPAVRRELHRREVLNLSAIGVPTSLGNWKIRRIRFDSLNYIRFMSTFEAFRLLRECIHERSALSADETFGSNLVNKRLIYFSRMDNRVKNQNSIQKFLQEKYNAEIACGFEKLTFTQKKTLLGKYSDFLMPPGSDNINGLCFSSENARFYQMINCKICDILNSPFQSLAGLRYLLPFLNKLKLIPSDMAPKTYQGHSGVWSHSELEKHLLI